MNNFFDKELVKNSILFLQNIKIQISQVDKYELFLFIWNKTENKLEFNLPFYFLRTAVPDIWHARTTHSLKDDMEYLDKAIKLATETFDKPATADFYRE
mgnify:CR=1 FL=1